MQDTQAAMGMEPFAAEPSAATPLAVEAWRIRLVFCLIATAILACVFFGFAKSFLQDPDNWWHVKVGLDLLASRTFPTVDPYSYTFAGHPWIAKEWLGQILLTLAYLTGGWNGVALLTIAMVALTAFLLSWHLSDALKPTVAVGVTLITAFLVGPIYNARPHVFTLPIIIVWAATLFRAARNEQAPPLWLLPLLCLWANLHATFTFGFIIAAFAGLDLLSRIRLSNPQLLAKWIGFGLLCPLVTLLNPYGFKAILATFTVAYGNEAVPFITEWLPFDASDGRFQEAIMLLGVFGLLVSPLRIGWAKALFILFTLHIYLIHVRFIYMFFLLVPIVVADEIAEQYPSLSARTWIASPRDAIERFFARHFYPLGGATAVALVCAAAIFMTAYPVEPDPRASAKEALAFAEKNHLSGNVFNSYDFGGTLIFHGIKTFIDGRTDQLFLDGFSAKNEATRKTSGKPVLVEQLKKYAVDWALLTVDDSRIPFFDELANWKRVYADKNAVIYTRND
jgi:hypothetical protein